MPDNPYFVAPANPMQALLAGKRGYEFGQEQQQGQAREEAAKQFLAGDQRGAIATLLATRDIQGAGAIASIGNNERDFNFRTQESQRAQGNSDRDFGLRQTTANTAQIQTIKDANGNETLVRIDRQGNATPINTGVSQTPNNPFATGKFTQEQGKAATFVDRMAKSHDIITKNENINDGIGGYIGGVAAGKPAIRDSSAFNLAASPERQQTIQAQRDFVNAVLRRESGAAISQSEFDNAYRQYFPQPGDSQEVIGQKRANRLTEIQGFAREAGPNFTPPKSIVPAAKSAAPSDALQKARDAISKGAPKDAVLKRLQENGVDASGL